MLYSIIILSLALGVTLFYTRKLYMAVNTLYQEIQVLRYVSKELGKQQMMEAQAIQDLTEAFLTKKYGKKSQIDKSDPVFKLPHGEA